MPLYIYHGLLNVSTNLPTCILHGGAGPQDPQGEAAALAAEGLKEAASRCQFSMTHLGERAEWAYPQIFGELHSKRWTMSAADIAALQVVQALEADPQFNAGYGSALQIDGKARVSASFMSSSQESFAAVTNVEGIRHPSQLAYYLQTCPYSVLDSQGSQRLANDLGIPFEDLRTEKRIARWRQHSQMNNPLPPGRHGTVGAVSLDPSGNLAVATSTGGIGGEWVGRIGDTPTVAGNFCDSITGVSCTGFGEQIRNMALAARICHQVRLCGLPLHVAVEHALMEAETRGYDLALIALSRTPGNQECQWMSGSTAPFFIWGLTSDRDIKTFRDFK